MQFETLPVTRFAQNCSVLWCERTGRAAVIDPGGDLPEVVNFLELMELQVEVALVTHGHFDHCGAAAQFAAMTGARIEGPHRGDAALVGALEQQPAQHEAFVRAVSGAGNGPTATVRSYLPDRWLEHGDRVRFGEEELEVLHCPGHSRGHVAYFHRGRRQAFVGDILFRGAIGAWEHPDGDLPTLVRSIRHRLFALGDDVTFVPGHGETSSYGQERRGNPFVGDAAWERWCDRFPQDAVAGV